MTDGIIGGIVADPAIGGGLGGGQGSAGPPGASAYALAGGDAVWGSLAAWLASLQSGAASVMTFQIRGASSFTAPHGLPYQPRAWLVDAAGEAVDTDTLYAPGQVTVIFPGPFTGTLQLG